MDVFARETAVLAPFAFFSRNSAGRRYPEPPHPYRGPFQRDRERVLHCAAFRRLSEKTQVFTLDLGNYHRTRLTHTLEVTTLARTISRTLQLNEDLAETLGLLHDVGHPPYGHTGEDVLSELTESVGGFNHNAQALRVAELLEGRYPHITGLNLSEEVLQGQHYRAVKNHPDTASPLLEVQVVDAADTISYSAHDADDSLELQFLTLHELLETTLWRESAAKVRQLYTDLTTQEQRTTIVRDLLDLQVTDLVYETGRQLAETPLETAADSEKHPVLVRPSLEMAEKTKELRLFLFDRVYRHPKVVQYRKQVRCWVTDLFTHFVSANDSLPLRYTQVENQDGRIRAVADYIADMTDRSAKVEHSHLMDEDG